MNKNIFIIISCIVIFTSCITQPKLSIKPAKVLKKQELINKLRAENPDFTALSIKYTIKVEGKSLINSASGNIRIVKDSLIWGTMGMGMGIEIGRVLFFKKGFQALNFRNKTHYTGKYNVSQKLFEYEINFETLQSILTGSFYMSNNLDLTGNNENLTENENSEFGINTISANIKTSWIIDSNSFKIKELKIEKEDKPMEISVKFGNYITIGDKKFSNKITIKTKSGDKETAINIFYDKVKFDQVVKTPFKVPRKFNTVTIQ